ncbi:hypothetical protein EAG18_14305 [Pseudoalteromonas sp. J010]|uniref:DUF2946 family protein n=1 Tax=Pseudoalteromonas sp. J010 TaxID=998465 RepID=UPI000F648EA8|nr:hypothetical protein [Pseudoalteromonas sp. J010]RRS07966.1 hypothetical protein EAG18_14305 [Pseudoalteromonas sp. J010]
MAKLIMLILVLLVSVQSVNLFASEASLHQIEIAHLQQPHDHAEDASMENKEHHTQDCHHCGHCSGTHLTIVIVKSPIALSVYTHSEAYSQAPAKVRTFVEQTHRPPIV